MILTAAVFYRPEPEDLPPLLLFPLLPSPRGIPADKDRKAGGRNGRIKAGKRNCMAKAKLREMKCIGRYRRGRYRRSGKCPFKHPPQKKAGSKTAGQRDRAQTLKREKSVIRQNRCL
jgi:hypothetical protein